MQRGGSHPTRGCRPELPSMQRCPECRLPDGGGRRPGSGSGSGLMYRRGGPGRAPVMAPQRDGGGAAAVPLSAAGGGPSPACGLRKGAVLRGPRFWGRWAQVGPRSPSPGELRAGPGGGSGVVSRAAEGGRSLRGRPQR